MSLIIERRRVNEASAEAAFEADRLLRDGMGMVGFGIVELLDGDGRLKEVTPFANLITTAGDQYYAKKGIVGVSPANPSAPTVASGMKLGTGATSVAKSGAGGALVTYLSGSNLAFDSSFPAASAVAGTDTGWLATYKTTWPAGTATNSAITECVICNDAGTNATSSAANSYSRTVFTAQNKGASDILAITWNHKFLGA